MEKRKKTFGVIALIATCFVISCKSTKGPLYELPLEMASAIQKEYAEQCDKGLILYEMNCGKCHTQKVGNRKLIPDFTEAQLIGYKLRATNPDHVMHLTDESITAEELGLIMTFLTYKKKNKVLTAGK
jgi:hypothetical protein